MTERDLFLQALDIKDPAERAAFFDRACADAPELRAQVEQLLKFHERAGQFLDQPHPVTGADERTAAHSPASSAAETAGKVRTGPRVRASRTVGHSTRKGE